jgi:hypothetical protein
MQTQDSGFKRLLKTAALSTAVMVGGLAAAPKDVLAQQPVAGVLQDIESADKIYGTIIDDVSKFVNDLKCVASGKISQERYTKISSDLQKLRDQIKKAEEVLKNPQVTQENKTKIQIAIDKAKSQERSYSTELQRFNCEPAIM